MDTRRKILTPEAALALDPARPLVLVSGYFDVLRAEHSRELESVRIRTGAATLMVAVLPLPGELLNQRARAELVAAIRVVDYVVTADGAGMDPLIAALAPSSVARFEEADARRTQELVEHVHRRQIRE
jgi:bifunctional ADP-heptose synthase (sugar kinase/adenylyltransferase)